MASDKRVQILGLTPRQIVAGYNSADWEEFINEWAQSLRSSYQEIERFAGPGDKGRDVVGYYGAANTHPDWDNYQCKHYDHPLRPGDVWTELGKLCYYTFKNDYSIPKKYRFVAPYEVGPKLKDLLHNPTELRRQLIANWPSHCERRITDQETVRLEGALKSYVEQFDFSIVSYLPLLDVIQGHMKTPFWTTRFKLAPPPRPSALIPPPELEPHEIGYVRQLLDAYGDAENTTYDNQSALTTSIYQQHLQRSREWFYQAETLNRFSRDYFPPGAFDSIKRQVYDGVIDTTERDYKHGFERVSATTDKAATLVFGNSDLAPLAEVGDKKGLCHHLANDDKLTWVKK